MTGGRDWNGRAVAALRLARESLAGRDDVLENLLKSWETHVDQPELVIGIAGQEGRGKTCVATAIEGPQIRSFEYPLPAEISLLPPADAWVLVLAADQMGSLREKAFAAKLDPGAAEYVLALVNRTDMIPGEKLDAVLQYARSVFEPAGIQGGHILPVRADLPETWASSTREILGVWVQRRERLRCIGCAAVLERASDAIRLALERERDVLDALPDLSEARSNAERFELAMQTCHDALVAGADRVASKLGDQFSKELPAWIHTIPTNPEGQREWETALKDWVATVWIQRIRQELTTIIDECSEKVPEAEVLLHQVASPQGAAWRPAQMAEPRTHLVEGKPIGTQAAIPIATTVLGALLGLVLTPGAALLARALGGIVGGVVGAGIGQVVRSRVQQAGPPAYVQPLRLDEARQTFEQFCRKALLDVADQFLILAAPERSRLTSATRKAGEQADARRTALGHVDRLAAALSQLSAGFTSRAAERDAGTA